MDAIRKAKLEQRVILILLVVFAGTVVGVLRSVGILGRKAPKIDAVTELAGSPVSVPEAVQRFRERMAAVQPEEPQATAESESPEVAPVQYTASTLRDPMISLLPEERLEQTTPEVVVSPPPPPPQPPVVTVQGILWGNARPQALIDGQLYEVGDTIDGAKIIAITRDGAVLDVQGSTFVLSPSPGPHDLASGPGGSPTPGNMRRSP